jgi:hypothetical protein
VLMRYSRCLVVVLLLVCCALAAPAQIPPAARRKKVEGEVANKEHALARAERQHDSSAFKQLLRNDLIYVAFNGWVFTKADLISKMKYIDVDKYDTENVKVRLPNPHAALITYDLKAKASIAGHELPNKQYVSSLWVETRGKWELLFHQATPDTHP